MTEKVRRRWWRVVALLLAGFALGGAAMLVTFAALFTQPCPPVFSPRPGEIEMPRGPDVIPPRSLSRPHRGTPPIGVLAQVRGEVWVLVRVEANGDVGRAEVIRSSGFCPYDNRALQDVRRWKFRPAYRTMGETFASWTRIRFIYIPERRQLFQPQRFPPRTGENI